MPQYKQEYTSIELDCYPSEEGKYILSQYLESLQLMAKSLDASSETSSDAGAGFFWRLKIEAFGEWT